MLIGQDNICTYTCTQLTILPVYYSKVYWQCYGVAGIHVGLQKCKIVIGIPDTELSNRKIIRNFYYENEPDGPHFHLLKETRLNYLPDVSVSNPSWFFHNTVHSVCNDNLKEKRNVTQKNVFN